MTIRFDILSRLVMAKVLYVRGAAACENTRDKQSFAIGLLSLHDAVELVLGALADHLGVNLPERIGFMQYFDLIDGTIKPDKLPYRRELDTINRLRVNIKHRGILPDMESSRHFPAVVLNFLTDVCLTHLGVNFELVSLRDAVKDENTRGLLAAAEESITQGDFKQALEFMGYAWFRGFEQQRYVNTLSILYRNTVQYPEASPARIRFDLIERGIDQFLYFRFKNLIPNIGQRVDTGELVVEWGRDYGHPKNWTEQNARFAYGFVVDALMKALAEPDAGYMLVHYNEAYVDKLEPMSEEVIFYDRGFPPGMADPAGASNTIATGARPLGKAALTLRKGNYSLGWVTRNEDRRVYFVHLPPGDFYYVAADELIVTSVPREETESQEDGSLRLKPGVGGDSPLR